MIPIKCEVCGGAVALSYCATTGRAATRCVKCGKYTTHKPDLSLPDLGALLAAIGYKPKIPKLQVQGRPIPKDAACPVCSSMQVSYIKHMTERPGVDFHCNDCDETRVVYDEDAMALLMALAGKHPRQTKIHEPYRN